MLLALAEPRPRILIQVHENISGLTPRHCDSDTKLRHGIEFELLGFCKKKICSQTGNGPGHAFRSESEIIRLSRTCNEKEAKKINKKSSTQAGDGVFQKRPLDPSKKDATGHASAHTHTYTP